MKMKSETEEQRKERVRIETEIYEMEKNKMICCETLRQAVEQDFLHILVPEGIFLFEPEFWNMFKPAISFCPFCGKNLK